MTTSGQVTAGREWAAGWPVVLAAGAGIAVTISHFYSLGLMIGPLTRAYGWSRTQITIGPTIVMLINFVTVAHIGRMVDRLGVRRIALPGFVAYCTAFAMLGLAGPSIWTWYALWTLLGLAFPFASTSLWALAVASRFDRSRGLALAVALSGTGLIAAIMPLFGSWAIGAFGWNIAYPVLGASMLVCGLPLLFFFLYDARDLTALRSATSAAAVERAGMSFAEALRDRRFWMLAIATAFIGTSIAALLVHFIPIGTQFGIDAATMAKASSVIGATSIIGRISTGFLMDNTTRRITGGLLFLLPATACLILATSDGTLAMMILTGLVIGASAGAEFDVIAVLTSRYMGMRAYAQIYGQIVSTFGLGVGFGPAIAALLFDRFGSYMPVLYFLGTILVIASTLIFLLGREPLWEDAPVADLEPAAGA